MEMGTNQSCVSESENTSTLHETKHKIIRVVKIVQIFNKFLHQGVKKRMKPSHLIVTLLISRAFQRYIKSMVSGRGASLLGRSQYDNQTKQNKHTTFP